MKVCGVFSNRPLPCSSGISQILSLLFSPTWPKDFLSLFSFPNHTGLHTISGSATHSLHPKIFSWILLPKFSFLLHQYSSLHFLSESQFHCHPNKDLPYPLHLNGFISTPCSPQQPDPLLIQNSKASESFKQWRGEDDLNCSLLNGELIKVQKKTGIIVPDPHLSWWDI